MLSSANYTLARMLLLLAFLCSLVNAHSWPELLRLIGANGTFTGAPGYPRGMFGRGTWPLQNHTNYTFSDPLMVWKPDPADPTAPLCKPDTQTFGPPMNASFPRLVASPGSPISILYQENGHVTQPWNQKGKPTNRGTVYIYGTLSPKENELIALIHKVWNADGTGGDKRGKLLSKQNFDDGQCYQINNDYISKERQAQFPIAAPADPMGANLWCQNNMAVPADAQDGKPYTLYWVWDWPTAAGFANEANGQNETYTSCIDIDIVAPGTNATNKAAMKFATGQPVQSAAIPSSIPQLAGGKNMMVADAPPATNYPTSFYPSTPAPVQTSAQLAPAQPQPATTTPAVSMATTAAIQGSDSLSVVPIAPSGPATPPASVAASVAPLSTAAPGPSAQAPSAGGSLLVYPVTTIMATSLVAGNGGAQANAPTPAVASSAPVVSSSPVTSAAVASQVVSSAPAGSSSAAAVASQVVPSSSVVPSASAVPPTTMVSATSVASVPSATPTAASAPTGASNHTDCTAAHQKRSILFEGSQPEGRSSEPESEPQKVPRDKALRHSARFRHRHF